MSHPEFALQAELIELLNRRGAHNVFWFHPFNKASSPREGAMAKKMGVVAGTPDIIFFQHGIAWCLELKTENGKLSFAQDRTIERIRYAGIDVEIAYGYKDALRILKARGVLL